MSLYIFDLDGVIYRGEKLLPGVRGSLSLLRERREQICFLSNNSTLSRHGFLRKLNHLGIPVKLDELYPSSYLAAVYFSENKQRKESKVLVIGEEGLFEELRQAGIKIIQEENYVDYVVVGMDRKFNFEKLCQAYRAILKGARFIATNMDLTYPLEEETIPAAGAIVKAIEASTGKTPLVLGKPEVFGLSTMIKDKGCPLSKVILVGDRLETDILAGKRMGINTILVLSGISSQEEIEKLSPSLRPDYVISSLQDLPYLTQIQGD